MNRARIADARGIAGTARQGDRIGCAGARNRRIDTQRKGQAILADADARRLTFGLRVHTRHLEGPVVARPEVDERQVAPDASNAAILFLHRFDEATIPDDTDDRAHDVGAAEWTCVPGARQTVEAVLSQTAIDAVGIVDEVTGIELVASGNEREQLRCRASSRYFGAAVIRFEERRDVVVAAEAVFAICHDVVQILRANKRRGQIGPVTSYLVEIDIE